MTDPTHPPEDARERIEMWLEALEQKGPAGMAGFTLDYPNALMTFRLALRGLDMRPEWVERHGYVSLRLQRAEALLRKHLIDHIDGLSHDELQQLERDVTAFLAEGVGE